MGLRKLVRKVTKPVAKVLDKIIPNEIKPALPYVAAFAPYLAPASFAGASQGLGNFLRMGKYANVGGGALLGGGLNVLGQLSQEGNEGEVSGLSALLAAAQGASAVPSSTTVMGPGNEVTTYGGSEFFKRAGDAANTGIGKFGAGAMEKLASGVEAAQGTLGNIGDVSMLDIGKAAVIPFGQGSTDLAMGIARKALKDYETELAAYNEQVGAIEVGNDIARRSAIIASMTAAQLGQDVIDSTLEELGLKEGGIVSLNMGGSVLPSGKEMDYRGGGFIPMGSKERADDVPARLSKNEFVMTADAVRAAGGGSVNEGAKRMYNLMNNLEARV